MILLLFSPQQGDHIVKWVLGGLVRWDAQYFMHIAQYGYTHENTLAFFPLFPLIVRFVASIIGIPLLYFLNYYSVLLIAATLTNFFLFVKTAVVFHRLSEHVLRDDTLAYRAALLFCLNPASIFFSAPYSEGIFAFLTFSGLLFNETWTSSSFAAGVFGLASAARSNGLVNVGFVLYRKLQDCSNYFYRLVFLFIFYMNKCCWWRVSLSTYVNIEFIAIKIYEEMLTLMVFWLSTFF